MTKIRDPNDSLTPGAIGVHITRLAQQLQSDRIEKQPGSGKLGDSAFYDYYRSVLSESEVKLTDEIEEPSTCLEIVSGSESIPLGTLGNFMLIIGKAKSRKTYLLSAIVAALIKPDTLIIDKLRGQLPTNKRTLLYFDTEQHKGHVKRVLKRIANLTGDFELTTIKVYQLKKYPPNQRLNAIQVAIEDATNLGLIVIDGIRDTVFDINDAKEATERATDLLRWTEEKDAHLITVIHENKGNSNARGHLGSELVNKAETVISVARDQADKAISVVTPEYCRNKEFEPFGFSVGEDELPYLCGGISAGQTSPGRQKKPTVYTMRLEDKIAILKRAFDTEQSLRYGYLTTCIVEASEFVGLTLAKSRAETFIKEMTSTGYLTSSTPTGERYPVYQFNKNKALDSLP